MFVNKLFIYLTCASQKLKGILMWKIQHIIFIWRQRYWQILKCTLVCLVVSFVFSCCQYLKPIILKTFNQTFLAFLPVEFKTNILYVNINFAGKLFFGFGRYCRKVLPEHAVSHPFWAHAFTENSLSIFFARWLLVNDRRNKRVSAFIIFVKLSCFESNLFFKQAVLVLALGEHDNLWFLLNLFQVHH